MGRLAMAILGVAAFFATQSFAIECTTERSHLANLLLSKFGAVQDLNKEIQDLKNKSIIPKTIGACSAAQDSCTNNFCGNAYFKPCHPVNPMPLYQFNGAARVVVDLITFIDTISIRQASVRCKGSAWDLDVALHWDKLAASLMGWVLGIHDVWATCLPGQPCDILFHNLQATASVSLLCKGTTALQLHTDGPIKFNQEITYHVQGLPSADLTPVVSNALKNAVDGLTVQLPKLLLPLGKIICDHKVGEDANARFISFVRGI